MKKHLVDSKGEIVFSDLGNECLDCIRNNCLNGYAHISCPKDNKQKRLRFLQTKNGSVSGCSSDCKTTRIFNSDFDSLVMGIKYFEKTKADIVRITKVEEVRRVERLVHNLKTLNGQCIQELYNIVPQDRFLKNINSTDSVRIVQDVIFSDPKKIALASLRLAKHLMAVKSEFSVYEMFMHEDVVLHPKKYKLRDVLMLVLYKFFGELYDIGVTVEVEEFYEFSYFDFDTMNVALYYIVENISKYVCPHTKVKVNISSKENCHVVEFEMHSLSLDKDEEGKIFHENYSGIQAKKLGKNGCGLGMYRARRLLEMNQATIDFTAGDIIFEEEEASYSDNIITIEIPKG